MANTNGLSGFCCPKCGSDGPFNIGIKTVVTMHDDGTGDTGDTEFDGWSCCGCLACSHEGFVKDFSSIKPGYTVVLVTPDYLAEQYGEDFYIGSTEADSKEQAVTSVQSAAKRFHSVESEYSGTDAVDFAVVAVFKGRHEQMSPNEI